jgi:hypothetical protein
MGRRGSNAFKKNDAVRALQSARDGGLNPTGMEVAIATDGSVVFRIFTDQAMQPATKEVMSAKELDDEIAKLKAKKDR